MATILQRKGLYLNVGHNVRKSVSGFANNKGVDQPADQRLCYLLNGKYLI